MRWTALILLVLLVPDAAVAEEIPLPAPYQVQGIVQERSDRYDEGLSLAPRRIAVDL